jgi:hypothetical protein
MNRTIYHLAAILIVLAMCSVTISEASNLGDEPDSGHRPLTEFLDENGHFHNPDGYTGTLSVEGAAMQTGADGAPVFTMGGDPNDNWTLHLPIDGVNNRVYAIAVDGDQLYVGGNFSQAGGKPASSIARYDMSDQTWHPLGGGVNNRVSTIVVDGDHLYVGGFFTVAGGITANRVARYDITSESWSSLGNGVDNLVYAMVIDGDDLYVGGSFTEVDGEPISRIARYNLSDNTWSSLGSGTNGAVLALAVDGDHLYVGGGFTAAGGSTANRIVQFDTSDQTWHPLGAGVNNRVDAIVVDGDNLYVGGDFEQAGGSPANRIARYDLSGQTWHPLGNGVDSRVNAIVAVGDHLYVGGDFEQAGGSPANRVARYDLNSENWHALSNSVTNTVHDLAVSGDDLFVGGEFTAGEFTSAGSQPINRVARLHMPTETIHYLGSGIRHTVIALAVDGQDLYVGGQFEEAGGITVNRIARYNMMDGSWHDLGGGLNHNVLTLLIAGDNLFVGGQFTEADGIEVNRIARYDMTTSTWHTMGAGSIGLDSGYVSDLAIHGNDLYVAGSFTQAGGISANRIARYDITENSWHALGSGLDGTPFTIIVEGDDLYAGGNFGDAGGESVNYIARYNLLSGSWHDLNGGVNNWVHALAVSGDDLIVGGDFTSAGGEPASRIARFDTNTDDWHALGDGVNDRANTFAIAGNDLYVGGQFGQAGGVSANRIARYDMDTNEWEPLGDGVGQASNTHFRTLAISGSTQGSDLYVGGRFFESGGEPTSHIARWSGLPPTAGEVTLNSPANESLQLSLQPELNWSAAQHATSYHLQIATDEAFVNLVKNENGITSTSFTPSIGLERATTYFWRVRGSNSGMKGEWSESWSFTTIPEVPAQVVLATPADEQEDVELQPVLTWEAAEGAESYEVEFADNGDWADSEVWPVADGTEISIEEDLDRGTSYFWRVRGVNPGGEGEWSEAYSFTTIPEVSPQVVLLSPDDEAENLELQPTLEWEEADGALSYEIEFADNGDWTDSDIIEHSETTYTFDSDLDREKTYFWRVRGVNAGGEGEWSEAQSFTTIPEVAPPITLQYPADGAMYVDILPSFGWDDAAEAEQYELQVGDSPDFSVTDQFVLVGNSYQYEDALGLEETYYWRVRGINAGGDGEWSEVRSFTTRGAISQQIVLLTPDHDEENVSLQPTLAWEDGEGAVNYELELADNGDWDDSREWTVTDGTQFTLEGDLERDQTYFWRVRGTSPSGTGEWSVAHRFTTIPEVSDQVVLLTPDNEAENKPLQPTLVWESADGALSYELEVADNGDWDDSNIIEVSDTTYTFSSDLERDQAYFWRVRGINPGGEGEWSEEYSFTTIPNVPEQVALSAPADEAVNIELQPALTWESADGAESYELEFANNGDWSGSQLLSVENGTEYTFSSDLDRDQSYFWRVRGVNPAGNGEWSEAYSFTTIPEIAAQVVLSIPHHEAINIGLQPTLQWEDADGAVSYDLEIADNSDWSDSEVITITETFYTLENDLERDQTYYWRVRGINPAGDGEWSEVFSFTTIPHVAPQIVLLSPADEAENEELQPTLVWEEAIGANSYELEVADNGDWADSDIIEVSDTTYTFSSDLDRDQAYFWRVRGINSGGAGEWSEIYTFTTIPDVPAQLVLFTPLDEATDVELQPTLEWEPSDGAVTYELEFADNGDWSNSEVMTIPETNYTFEDDLDRDQIYFWRVRGINSGGEGEWSEVYTFTTLPEVPAQVVLSTPADEAVNVELQPALSWEEAGGAESYELEFADNGDWSGSQVISVADGTEYTFDNDLDRNQTYFWRVRGINSGGAGEWSEEYTFTTIPDVPGPIVLVSPINGADQVGIDTQLTWQADEHADSYRLMLSENGDFESAMTDTVLSEAHIEGLALDFDQLYTWRVKGINAGGAGEWSESFTFRTQMQLPSAVELLSPEDGEGAVPRSPQFSWLEADYAEKYEIAFSSSADFEEVLLSSGGIESATFTPESVFGYYESLYWRVRAVNRSGEGAWSDPARFVTVAEEPHLAFPSNGSGQISIAPLFQWNSPYEESAFRLQLSSDEDFAELVSDTLVAGDRYASATLLADTGYFWRVRVESEQTESEWSLTHDFTTRPDPTPDEGRPSFIITTNFGGAADEGEVRAEDYRLISLPGSGTVPVESILDGEHDEDWTLYLDNGLEQDYLVEYRPNDERFQFRAGNGFWLLSPQPMSVEYLFDYVEISERDSYAIPLQPGWNIISNPFHLPVQWSDVQEFNSLMEVIYSYDNGFEPAEVMLPTQGYYLYNPPENPRQSLEISYTALANRGIESGEVGQAEEQVQSLAAVVASAEGPGGQSIEHRVEIVFPEQSEYEVSLFNRHIPGDGFGESGLLIAQAEEQRTGLSRIGSRLGSADEPYELEFRSPVGTEVEWRAELREMPASSAILLVHPITQQMHLLRDGDRAVIRSTEPSVPYDLYVGDEAELQEMRNEMMPQEISLMPNYPNPFNPVTSIRYSLPATADVRIEVFDVLGRRVQTLFQGEQQAGWHAVQFDGRQLASGIYFYRLQSGTFIQTGTMTMIK